MHARKVVAKVGAVEEAQVARAVKAEAPVAGEVVAAVVAVAEMLLLAQVAHRTATTPFHFQ